MNHGPEYIELNVDHFLISTYENQLLFVVVDEAEGQISLH